MCDTSRELDWVDILIIICEGETEPRAINLLCHWMMGTPSPDYGAVVNHPSFQWWAKKHGSFVSRIACNKDWYEQLR